LRPDPYWLCIQESIRLVSTTINDEHEEEAVVLEERLLVRARVELTDWNGAKAR
jgi:hypothetical protein